MEKRVISLLGVSFFLVLCGVVLYLWSLFDPTVGSVAGALAIALFLVLVVREYRHVDAQCELDRVREPSPPSPPHPEPLR